MGPDRDFSDMPFDGLVQRHQRLMSHLEEQASVVGLAIGSAPDIFPVAAASFPVSTIEGPRVGGELRSPGRRLMDAALGRTPRVESDWSRHLVETAREFQPDVVVSFGPWLDSELTPLFREWPCIHVFEEELTRMPELAPQSVQARALRRAEFANRRRKLPLPRTVVVISEPEIAYALRRFGSAPAVVVVPQTLPTPDWKPFSTPSEGRCVLALGNFSEGRNAEGLVRLILAVRESPDRPPDLRLSIVSGPGFSPELRDLAGVESWIELVDGVASAQPLYRQSRIAVVPAARATGFKATILQAWLSGTAVVATAAAADTVESRNRAALAVGESPRECAQRIVRLWRDEAARVQLALAGCEAASRDHSDDAVMAKWRDLVLSQASSEACR